MKLFEEITLEDFPAEECTIPLNVNGNFFKSNKRYMVIIYDVEEDSILIKNLYPCLGEIKGEDLYGFVGTNELEFYSFKNEKFLLKGFSEECDTALFIADLKQNIL